MENFVEIRDTIIAAFAKLQPDMDFKASALPPGWSIESLEQYQEYRNRFKAKYETDDFTSFVAYAKELGELHCFCTNNQAVMIFDMGSSTQPGHGQHTAKLTLKKTAGYGAVTEIEGRSLSQKDFSDWLLDWRTALEIYPSRSDVENKVAFDDAVQRFRDITVESLGAARHATGDFSSEKSGSAKIEAKAKGDRPIPGFILFACSPYRGFEERVVGLQVSVSLGKDEPTIRLRIVGKDALDESIALEFAEMLGEHFNVLRGTITL